MFVRSCCCVGILLAAAAVAAAAAPAAPVFVQKREANGVLGRWRRANSGFLEELQKGNLERECVEEVCDYEEAREVFEDDAKTRQFWLTYERRDPCQVNPCHNNGTCEHLGTTHVCFCARGFGGKYCERDIQDLLKCVYMNGGCQHFCDGSQQQHTCFCAAGYTLAEDGHSCIAEASFACGRLPPQEVDQTNHAPPAESPWQVLVLLDGVSHCGGALLNSDWVVTAAHCVHERKPENLSVVAGENDLDVVEDSEQRVPVAKAIAHHGYVPTTADHDVALLRLSRPVTLNRHAVPLCLPTASLAREELLRVRYHAVSGWGLRTAGGNAPPPSQVAVPESPVLRKFTVPMMPLSSCMPDSANFNFSDSVLCAGYADIDQPSCRGDDGSPLVTVYGSTHFLTGLVAWGRGCASPGIYGIYTKMADYIEWAERVMKDGQ